MPLQSNCNICNSQNNSNKEFFSNILEPLNYHFIDGSEKKPDKSTVSLCHKLPNGDFRQLCIKVSVLERVLPWIQGLTDYYSTTNQFTWNRLTANVNGLVMLTCDLDTYKTDKYLNTTHDELIRDVKSVCVENSLPFPTEIMFSGQGYYLKWIFSEKVKVSPKDQLSVTQRKSYGQQVITKVDSWRIAQRVINKLFLDFGADMKATDVSRVLRMAGTINGKTVIDGKNGRFAEVLEFGKTISFQDMLNVLQPHTSDDDINEIVPAKKIKISKEINTKTSEANTYEFLEIKKPKQDKPASKNLIPKNLKDLQMNREADLWRLIAMRGGKAQNGYRMHYLFYMLCFRAGIGFVNPDNFHDESLRLGNIIYGDDDFEISALSSLEKRVEQYRSTHYLHKKGDRACSPIYTISNDKLINIFNISEEEQTQLVTILSKEEINRRAKIRKYDDRRAKGMKEQIYSDNRNKPWEKLGIGRTSWKKYGKPESLTTYHANIERHKAILKANKKRDQLCPV